MSLKAPARLLQIDYELIRQARKENFLVAIDPGKLAPRKPTGLCACSDYRQGHDLRQRKATALGFFDTDDPLFHLFGWHGGILRVVPHRRNDVMADDYVIFRNEILQMAQITPITDLFGYIHLPCKYAMLAGMNFNEQVKAIIEAKRTVEGVAPELNVAPFCHVDYGHHQFPHEGKKTYFVRKDKWPEWLVA